MPQSEEKQFGALVRRNRLFRFGCTSREEFCTKYKHVLDGITPEILRDMEKGNLLGSYDLGHMACAINLIWDTAQVRLSMLELAYKVDTRILEAHAKGVIKVHMQILVPRQERRLPHRERI